MGKSRNGGGGGAGGGSRNMREDRKRGKDMISDRGKRDDKRRKCSRSKDYEKDK